MSKEDRKKIKAEPVAMEQTPAKEKTKYEVSRNFFLEINPGAECFEEMPLNRHSKAERMSPKFEGTLWVIKPAFYAFIKHDKDIEEDGSLKEPHYHLFIKYKGATTFSAVQKQFPGAHIEMSQSVVASVQYLTHQNKPEKALYLGDDIITNNKEMLKRYLSIPRLEEFNKFEIWDYVYADRMFSYTAFCIRFGVDQVKAYRTDIQQCIADYMSSRDIGETMARLEHKRKR